MGVYTWIRDCVRQAVLLGFNDAIDQIGPPTQATPLNENLAAVLGQPRTPALRFQGAAGGTTATISAPSAAVGVAPRPKRRRLGRALGPMEPPTPPKS